MKTPPHALESESFILGMIILYPECFWDVSEKLEAGDFFREANNIIFNIFSDISLSG